MQQRFVPLMHDLSALCGARIRAHRKGNAPMVERDKGFGLLITNAKQVATAPTSCDLRSMNLRDDFLVVDEALNAAPESSRVC